MVPDNTGGAATGEGQVGRPDGPLTGLSSMATRAILAELAQAYERSTARPVAFLAVGGVDAARRVRNGETFDVVVLARDSIDKLAAAGHLIAGSVVDLAHSPVAVAVPAGAARPDIGSEAALRQAVRQARTVGYSTGPSGVALAKLFEAWGLAEELRERTVVALPGIPVGELVARAEVTLGFQQLSELVNVDGIDVVGRLPAALDIVTTFSGAVGARSRRVEEAAALLRFLASPAADQAKQRRGMEPARSRREEETA
jgi:molybdate transport system substrate-binding protein